MPVSEPNPSAPIVIDALTLARSGAECDYQFRQRYFSRLTGMVVSDQPALDVTLRFDLLRGKPLIHGQLQGAIELICQRCMRPMRPMRLMLDEKFALLVSGVGELIADTDDEEEDDDEVAHTLPEMEEWVADATRIDVIELVEEQIILALPLVPKHDDEQACAVLQAEVAAATSTPHPKKPGERIEHETDAGEGMRRPFADLRELLRK